MDKLFVAFLKGVGVTIVLYEITEGAKNVHFLPKWYF